MGDAHGSMFIERLTIKRVDLGDFHVLPIPELGVIAEALLQAALEDGEHGRPSSNNDSGASVSELLCDGPSVASRVGNTRDERNLTWLLQRIRENFEKQQH